MSRLQTMAILRILETKLRNSQISIQQDFFRELLHSPDEEQIDEVRHLSAIFSCLYRVGILVFAGNGSFLG